MNGFREFQVSDEAKAKAQALGMTGDIQDRLQRMGKRSAPHTHPRGNRRFDHYVLKIVNGILLDIHDMATEPTPN